MHPRGAALAVAVVALAGCGGSDRLSAAAYRTQAARICADADRRAKALPRPRNLDDLRSYMDRTLVILRDDTARLRALKPPSDLQDGHAAALRAQDEAIRVLRRLGGQLDAPKPSADVVQTGLARVARLGQEADRQFRRIGLPRCAG